MPRMPPMPAGASIDSRLAAASSAAAAPVTPVPNSDSQYDYYEEEEESALAVAPIGAAPAPSGDDCTPSAPGCVRALEAPTLTQHAACC